MVATVHIPPDWTKMAVCIIWFGPYTNSTQFGRKKLCDQTTRIYTPTFNAHLCCSRSKIGILSLCFLSSTGGSNFTAAQHCESEMQRLNVEKGIHEKVYKKRQLNRQLFERRCSPLQQMPRYWIAMTGSPSQLRCHTSASLSSVPSLSYNSQSPHTLPFTEFNQDASGKPQPEEFFKKSATKPC